MHSLRHVHDGVPISPHLLGIRHVRPPSKTTNVNYRSDLLVLKVEEHQDGRVSVLARDLSDNRIETFQADRVFIAAGAVGSTRCPWPVLSPRWWPPKVPTPQSGCSGFVQRRSVSLLTRFLHAE